MTAPLRASRGPAPRLGEAAEASPVQAGAQAAVPEPAAEPITATPVGGRTVDAPVVRIRRRFFSKLTARVLAVNMMALMMLVGGMLYLSSYQERLIENELSSLDAEATILAANLAEAAVVGGVDTVQSLDPDTARQIVRRVYQTNDTRARLFGADGKLVADSRMLGQPGGIIEVRPLLPPQSKGWLRSIWDAIYDWSTEFAGPRKRWPAYVERQDQQANDYASVRAALGGGVGRQIWTREDGKLMLGVAVPVQRVRLVLGAVLMTREGVNIEGNLQTVREEILKVFAIALGVTIILSLYLAGTITRPIRRLARAAERVQQGRGRKIEIPDMSGRRDEIGELASALRAMTAALWNRIDAIERFAADVSHEIKNPLTSLRSAVETTARITDPAQQRRLMTIILEDVQRLDRLITDISDASRLDAELSRAETETVDIARMLGMLTELYKTTLEDTGLKISLSLPPGSTLTVPGIEDRLVQVFRNLITNAISFSPPDGAITLRARREGAWVIATVEDDGPGIPPAKLEAIFDRFYTERPAGEKFGTHSGLGLSISKQIITAHRGQIFAENREGRPGARFTVKIPAK
ncbi:HAMP domain-containing histidine kinase [Inquilinus limosus]|uniref:HAMP domain-containing histidine kinase n=1 Tax=Inquilinus limosus TaxID=171674 RepID=UPI0003F75FD1|nr:HAMP domain-containing histidine kinase [Inquilinus limosus]